MPVEEQDILLTTDQDFRVDHRGDLATVTGNEYIKQRIAMECLDEAHDFVGSPGTANDVEELKVELRNELQKLRTEGIIERIERIEVTSFEENTVTVVIDLLSDQLELKLP